MISEIWTAVRKEESGERDNPYIIFEVKDESVGETREEKRYESALPLMMQLGGYPPAIAAMILMKPFPWRFRKTGNNIYLDGPSMGIEGYHPITD